jgi:acetylornithine deacetylase/succinyl-diaminopimelate desuccinylase-like protein
VLACDTERAATGVPAVTISQRGHAALLLRVDAGGQPVHAGRLGGAVIDPSIMLAQILARMQSAVSAMTPAHRRDPGHGHRPRPVVQARRDSTIRRLAGDRATHGEALERRITICPAFSIVLLRAGTGRAAVPSQAEARLDVRLPAGADVRAAVGHLARVALSAAPADVDVQLTANAMTFSQRLSGEHLVLE